MPSLPLLLSLGSRTASGRGPPFFLFRVGAVSGAFPTQFAGLRVFYGGAVQELCLVASGDAVGGLRIDKNGTTYGIYLVPTSDPNASSVRINTGSGIMAIRLKT